MSDEIKVIDESSYGVIPVYEETESGPEFLLVRHAGGHWAFPKGRKEEGESDSSAALRELEEETGLKMELDDLILDHPLEEAYEFVQDGKRVNKKVIFFIGRVRTKTVAIDENEIVDHRWCAPDVAYETLTFDESKRLLMEAQGLLSSLR
jgi:bis(5'-nucleosidyl)-tetraphosphatase